MTMIWQSQWSPLLLSAGEPDDNLIPIYLSLSLLISSIALILVLSIAAFFLEFVRKIGCKHSLERSAASDTFFEDPNSLKKVPCPTIFDPAEKYMSLIVPAYNEEHRLPVALVEALNYLEQRATTDKTFTYEVLIVDDGSNDRTSKVAFEFVRKYKFDTVRVILLGRNHGKGEAIRKGMLHSRGELLLMLDADGATKVTDLEKLERQICALAEKNEELNSQVTTPNDSSPKLSDIEVSVFGSRAHLEKQALAMRKWYRNLLMKGFHIIVLLAAGPGIRDTQCGFKMFTRAAARPLPPPPPMAPSRAEKDREYRRRSSPSPPPYRDRRHSPPRRSPPPGGSKRSRRDDGGYDRRRGSPRGGVGSDDRRYGYDYGGGYERGGPGGRGGYGDERSHGRYINRLSDWPDSGRGGYGDGSNIGTAQREGLMLYKQFIQELEDDILPAEAECRYEEYRSEYISTQKRAYFEAHKDEDWLKDKYHPTNLTNAIERRNEQARVSAKEFLLDLQSGTLDLGPGLTASTINKSEHGSNPNSDDEADNGGKRRRHARAPAKDVDLHSAAPRAPPVSSESRRIQVDIEQAQALVCRLDAEKGIKDNVLCSSDHDKLDGEKSHGGSIGPIIIIRGLTTVKGLEGAELLDTLITYLWRIHHLDYYGMSERNDAKGLRHVRMDSKTTDGSTITGLGWEQKLDAFWQERLRGQDPLEIMTAKEKIDASAVEFLDPYVRKIRDEKYGWKYGCGAKGCTKLFHAADFVHKHLKLKHPEVVIELTSKVREDLYFQNYMSDANAPGGTPIMQQSAQVQDKAMRRRPVSDRLRDERGNRREYDRNGRFNDHDRFDRAEGSPSRDANGGPDGGGADEPMYDAYGGQGLVGAPPFPSDIPHPPVLMPVPGAGPLGPFVPAPPEVAMRMLMEHGGPTSFEANGSPRGRKGRPTIPQLPGTAPIIAVSPSLRHDPRRIRSYQDLDAPDDEVTVIDYRSL